MLVLLLLYYLTQSAFAGTVSLPSIEERTTSSCNNLHGCRTIWNIIWSCLVTIFSCTWIAIHPNIPYPGNKKDMGFWGPLRSSISHRLPLFICALLVPEYILSWAIRQRLVAGKIAEDNGMSIQRTSRKSLDASGQPGWTMTHGFFVIMGGFHLFRRPAGESGENVGPLTLGGNDTPLHPLSIDLLRQGKFEFIMPTEEEIKDKGKSNWLAKALVLVQTTWFVMQCIARGIRHLPVTELEIVTLAYATMSFGMYLFWWDKPLDVGRPIRVFTTTTDGQGDERLEEKAEQTVQEVPGLGRRLYKCVRELEWEDFAVGMAGFVIGQQDTDSDMLASKVPTFWSGNPTDKQSGIAGVTTLMAGIIFGAIHCIAWSFEFPSHAELVLWRISSIGIIATPVYFLVSLSFLEISSLPMWVIRTTAIPLVTLMPLLYIVARAVTVVLAFTSLRALPPAAYEMVHWTTFIPHI